MRSRELPPTGAAPPAPHPQEATPAGAPADLGAPDADGVYTYAAPGGAKLYFRLAPRARDARGDPLGPPQWQWSTSRRLWLPTSAVRLAVWGRGRLGDASGCSPAYLQLLRPSISGPWASR
jgi:hypothetical protein